MKSSEAMIFAVMSAIFAIAERSLKNSGLQRGLTRDLARSRVAPESHRNREVTGIATGNRDRNREVTGSNPVEVLNFSDFSPQLQKLPS